MKLSAIINIYFLLMKKILEQVEKMNKKNQEQAYPVVPKLSRATQNSESSDGEQEAYFNSQRK